MQEQTNLQQHTTPFQQQQTLTYSTSVLVLGILSIVTCWCYGIVGIILGVIAIVQAKKATELYNANPAQYSVSSFNNMKAGKVCGIIGLIFSVLFLFYIIFWIVFFGSILVSLPWNEIDNIKYY